MTYLEFLLLFDSFGRIVPGGSWKKKLDRLNLTGIALIAAVALIYTTPWDNYLIMRGVWSYPEGVVFGTFGYVPIEEYGFMIMQTLLAGALWSMNLPKNNQEGLSFSAKGIASRIGHRNLRLLLPDSGVRYLCRTYFSMGVSSSCSPVEPWCPSPQRVS